MSRSARAAKGYVAGLIQYASKIGIQIVLAPVILMMAGEQTLGAYAAITQVISLYTIVDLTAAWSLDRFLAQAAGLQDDGKRFSEVFTTARTVLLVTNTLFAILVFITSFFVGSLFHLSPEIRNQARYALYVIAVWSIVKTPLVIYGAASLAQQDIAAYNMIGTITNVGRTVASLAFVLAGTGLFGLMIAGTTMDICGSFLYQRRFYKLNPEFKSRWGIPDRALLREMLGFGGYTTIMNLGNRLFFASANIIAGMTSGAVGASLFYSTQMPSKTVYNMLYRLTESATPGVHEIYGRRQIDKMAHVFQRLVRLMLMMTFPLAVGVVLFNRDVVTCWVGPKLFGGSLLTNTLAIYISISAIQGISILFCFAIGWVRLLAVTSFLQGLANAGLGYVLGRSMGLGGISLAIVVVMIPQLLLLLFKLNRFLKVNMVTLISDSILRSAVPLGLATAAGMYVHAHVLIARHQYGGLAAESLAFCVVYAIGAYFMVMHRQDQKDTRRYLLRMAQTGRDLSQRVLGTAS